MHNGWHADGVARPNHPFTPSPLHPLTLITAILIVAILWRVMASLPAADSRGRVADTALDRAAVLLSPAFAR